jgi:TM2 domain-containing membrane protein YozV
VTDQPWHDASGSDLPSQQPPASGSRYPPPYPQYPAPGPYHDPAAPFGSHPVTGQPFSDKSKTIAGLPQLLVGWLTFGIGLIRSIVDAILILTDKIPDPQGRPLRDGT